jgi:hypothetical protein
METCPQTGRPVVSAPSAQQIALACGVAGAYVDVTDDLVTDSITGSWGRSATFSDTRPGVFAFDLVNDAGKYTPGNAASSLSTGVRVGMGVSHIVDGTHFAGTIRSAQPYFTGPASLTGSSKIRITCDDVLGNASRTELTESLSEAMVIGAPAYFFWPLNDIRGSTSAAEKSGNNGPPIDTRLNGAVTFGVTGFDVLDGDTQLQLSNDPAGFPTSFRTATGTSPFQTVNYPTNSMGTWGFWITATTSNSHTGVRIAPKGFSAGGSYFYFGLSSTGQYVLTMGSAALASPMPLVLNVPRYLSLTVTNDGSTSITGSLYIDGLLQGSLVFVPYGADPAGLSTNALRTPSYVGFDFDLYPPDMAPTNVAHLSHTAVPVNESQFPLYTTEAVLLAAIEQTMPEVVLDTLPANLSTFPVGGSRGGSALDRFNDIIRTEQGYIWAETTGTLTSPIQKVKIRARDRPETIDAAHTFSIAEILNAPEFTTDIENMVSTTVVRGASTSATVSDPSLVPYVGSASDTASVLLSNRSDLTLWGQDRLLRGVNSGVRLPRFTVDALAINRWADISALRAGDRIRISDLPAQQLGVDYIDGWLLGASYSLRYPALHGDDQMLFTFALEPSLPRTAIFDTDRFMADGALTLSAGINSSVTSVSVATTGPKLETVTLPYDLLIDSEQVTVTACSSATPQVATIVRGVNGTAAASHTTAAIIEVVDEAFYAF